MTATVLSFAGPEATARRRQWLQEWCNVPEAYLHCCRESWDDTRSPWPSLPDGRPVDEWEPAVAESMLTLKGEPGIGKTHVGVALLVAMQRNPDRIPELPTARSDQVPTRFAMVRVPQAIRALRTYYETKDDECGPPTYNGRSAPRRLAWIADTFDLVLYDDWGAQSSGENWRDRVEGWVDERHARRLPTILTMNATKGTAPRIRRRIAEDGLVVDMPGKSQ